MSDNRKYAQAIYKECHQYIMNTFPVDSLLSADDAKVMKKNRADAAAKQISDEIIARGKPMGVWMQYVQQGASTQIYVFYHPNPEAHKVW